MNNYYLEPNAQEWKMRLDKFIANHLPELSRTRIKSLIEKGYVQINGYTIKDSSASVKPGVTYYITIPEAEPTTLQPADIKLDIVYEDQDILVLNKPAGLTVHPGAGNYQDTLANALLTHCGESLSGIGGVARPGIVHRLDKDTSGLMIVAKCDQAHIALQNQLKTRELSRIYQAITWGVPPAAGSISANIARSKVNRTKMRIVTIGGKSATTHYKLLQILANNQASLVECKLETGRTHQIRVHFCHLGHPLIGDTSYGSKRALKSFTTEQQQCISNFKRQALCATEIGFMHPISNQAMHFAINLPLDMQKLLDVLKE